MKTIEKIRQKIEELYDGEAPAHAQQCDFDDGYFTGIGAISKFLDTLEESEKPNQERLEEEIERYWKEEMPVVLESDLNDIARHFAQWGAEHLANSNDEVVINGHKVEYDKDKDAITMEAIPNDLKEAAREYAIPWDLSDFEKGEPLFNCYDMADAFKAGAKWDRQQMMKEAVECETVCIKDRLAAILPMKEFQWTIGDKVRVIVIPNTDKK